ncbi:tyrosine-type recombinase/integrase [Candidatus Clostridium stratigraminis]|uniref:Tyrosine-type recombinase/integrase n=1 Tax=Candidatus Clostridium stratigraminis TaxID=3381661 RepID=A0ABW8T618_9CLOT
MAERRKDNKGRVLKENETQRKDGSYDYRWRTSDGKRHSIYAPTLEELREKEQAIFKDKSDGIRTDAQKVTVNDIYDLWVQLKKGLKENTFQNYIYMYEQFVKDGLGQHKIVTLKRSDIRRYYNYLIDERCLKISSVDNVHTILHQVLDIAVEDGYLRNNISDNALKELKQSRNLFTEKRKALTVQEQDIFLDFLRNSSMYHHWYPIFALMIGTGVRVGEATGLRWCDVDFDNNNININHTLVYFNHAKGGCYFGVNTPKTRAGERAVPMIESVRYALLQEKAYQEECGITCSARIDGFTDFIFVNRFGNAQHQGTLNKALRRIIRDCNQEILDKAKKNDQVILLPKFSCHTLRHTFTTRLCESGINIKVIQSVLGHADISTTLDIYADVTRDLKKAEMQTFEDFMNNKKEAM